MKFRLFLMMLLMAGLGNRLNGQEIPNSNAPLTANELREGILRIEQGILSAKEAAMLKQSIADREALAQRERELAVRELDTERQRTDIANQRADVERTRAEFYENAFKTVSKGTSMKCKLARVFTLGLTRCGR